MSNIYNILIQSSEVDNETINDIEINDNYLMR